MNTSIYWLISTIWLCMLHLACFLYIFLPFFLLCIEFLKFYVFMFTLQVYKLYILF